MLAFGLLIHLLCFRLTAAETSMANQRRLFLETDRLLDQQRDAAARNKMVLLHDYVLLPYLEYKLLKHNLQNDAEIKSFLVNHKDTRYADVLRNQWLKSLAKRGYWRTFIDQWRGSNQVSLQCLYQLALYQTGKKQQAIKAATDLWLVGRSQPNECDALFKVLDRTGQITNAMVWQRFDLALTKGNVKLARYIMRRLSQKEQKTAKFWIKVHYQPGLIENGYWARFYTRQGAIFAHGIRRMARKDAKQAITTWDIFKDTYVIAPDRKRVVERQLALQLIYNREAGAYRRLAVLGDDDEKVRTWRVRAALREQNWLHVQAALARLTEEEKQQAKWLYWQARAAEQNGNKNQAMQLYRRAGSDRSFYGFIAAEASQLDYHFDDRPIVLKQGSLDRLLSKPEFAAANEFRMLERDIDARREWWYAVSKLNKEEIKTASKLAQLWQWSHIAVFTVAKAQYWDDLKLRFPVLYDQEIEKNAESNDLDASLLFGLIRQESVFDRYAWSSAGARGLMQIMPKTGRQIARDLREKWRSSQSLFNPDVNIRYGSYYYKQLLDRFDGHFALATAAYNAGPHRVDLWLPETKALPTDIWIETIPYNETRKYVAKVLAYALIYQNRTGQKGLNMYKFLKQIDPTGKK